MPPSNTPIVAGSGVLPVANAIQYIQTSITAMGTYSRYMGQSNDAGTIPNKGPATAIAATRKGDIGKTVAACGRC